MPDDSIAAIHTQVREWLSANWTPGMDRNRWADLVLDSGWSAPSWEPQWWGRGLTDLQSRAVAAEFVAVGAPGTGHDRANLFACTLREEGTDEQKRRLIPPSLRGESKWCLLYSEPDAGSDLAGLRTRADRGADRFIVNGQKVWTSFAATADYGLLIARTNWDVPKHQGISFFMLPMRQPGVEVRPIHQITGESEFNEVFLTDAVVPAENMVGQPGDGWRVLQSALGYERRLMGDLARTSRSARKPQDDEDVLIALARRYAGTASSMTLTPGSKSHVSTNSTR